MLNLLEKNVQIIGLTGKAGSGKDFIASECMPEYFKFALANHFKIDVVRKYIFTYEEVFDTKPANVRHRLQQIGTEENRDKYGMDTWVDAAECWIHSIYKANKITKFVISDVRFDNEAEWIRRKGGLVVKILSDRSRDGMDAEALKHPSEAGVRDDLIDNVIINNIGTDAETLKWQMKQIYGLHSEIKDRE